MSVRRGNLHPLDEGSGLFHGKVGVAAGTPVDARVSRYRCGVPADHFTQESLATRAPVLVADAQEDPRPVRSAIREWGIRSILGVPMIVGDEVRGLLSLDDIDRPHESSGPEQGLASAFAGMAPVAITTAVRGREERWG